MCTTLCLFRQYFPRHFPLPHQNPSCYKFIMDATSKRVSLAEIFLTFAMVGLTGFGGGMAIVAMLERICVREKRWISSEEFLHGLAFSQILGPFSLNVCTFTGHHLRGIRGGVAAAVGFILPSFLIISAPFLAVLQLPHAAPAAGRPERD